MPEQHNIEKTNSGEIILYQNPDGKIKIDVRLEDETVWLTQDQMATLFGKAKSTINEHIKNIYDEHELEESATMKKFGISEFQQKAPFYYNLDVIISVGYRVRSLQGTQFRIWATQRLKEYIIKGFTLNDDRFKSGTSMNYFNELQERIREIRLSERFFYQKIKDIYTTSIDYDPERRKDDRVFQGGSKQTLMGYQPANGCRIGISQGRCCTSVDGNAIVSDSVISKHWRAHGILQLVRNRGVKRFPAYYCNLEGFISLSYCVKKSPQGTQFDI